jgi:signal transduction histidine kinase
MTHTALRFSRSPYSRAVLAGAYGLTCFFLVCCSLNIMWTGASTGFSNKQALGLTITFAPLVPTAFGKAFFATAASLTVVTIHEFGHALRHERREVQPALLGAIVLAVTQLNDIANALKWVSTINLMAFGYATFAVGILLTVVSRYGTRSRALQRRTEDLKARGEQVSRASMELEVAQTERVRSKRLAAVGELAAVVAHEVRNPLAIVTNAIVSLRKSDASLARREVLLRIIDEEIRRLERLAAQ